MKILIPLPVNMLDIVHKTKIRIERRKKKGEERRADSTGTRIFSARRQKMREFATNLAPLMMRAPVKSGVAGYCRVPSGAGASFDAPQP